jgi:putative ABC transport system substrate-binding protein
MRKGKENAMAHIKTLATTLFLGVFMALVAVPANTAQAADPVFAVVTDADLPVYRKVVTGIGIESKADFFEFTLRGNAKNGPKVMKKVLDKKPTVIIAIGPKAANAARKATRDVPVIYCLVPRLDNYNLSGPNMVGVRLERTATDQLTTLKKLLPKMRRVGVVFDPKNSSRVIAEAKKAARNVGVDLVEVQIKSPRETKSALAKVKGKMDALWMISDPTVLNLATLEAMLTFSLEERVPFFALNRKFVERGALVSFAIDYAQTGRQVASLANRIAYEAASPKRLGVQPPEGLDVAINLTTARRIGAACDLALDVFTFAAENDYAIRVYK